MSNYEPSMTFDQVYRNAITNKGKRIAGTSSVEHSMLIFDYMIDYIDSLEHECESTINDFLDAENKTSDDHNNEIKELTSTIADLKEQVSNLGDENQNLTEIVGTLL